MVNSAFGKVSESPDDILVVSTKGVKSALNNVYAAWATVRYDRDHFGFEGIRDKQSSGRSFQEDLDKSSEVKHVMSDFPEGMDGPVDYLSTDWLLVVDSAN